MANTVNESAIKKLKLLFTVVDRPKGEFYLDVLGQFDVNFQMILGSLGTANSELLELLAQSILEALLLLAPAGHFPAASRKQLLVSPSA